MAGGKVEKKPTIKYLDAYGEYQYATVIDIGEMGELLTPVKNDLVSAINSIIENGLGGGDLNQEWIDYIGSIEKNIDDVINSIGNGYLSEKQLEEIQKAIDYANAEIKRLLSIDFTSGFDQIREEYDRKVQEINNNVDGVTNNLEAAKKSLESVREHLSNVELNVTTVTESIDYVKGELLTKVDSTTFELLEATVNDNSTEISQNAEEIKLKASQESLDLATQDIQQLQADFSVTAEAIEGTVKKSELIGELDGLDIYPPTLLRGSRDWWEWESTIPVRAYVKSETYQHASVQEQVGFNAYLTKELTDLEIGKTYVASVWIKSEATHAKPVFKIGSTNHFMKNNNTSDEFLSDIWQRYSVSFVADKEIVIVGYTTTETVSGDVVQFAGGKVEIGTRSTGWREHEDDNHNRLVVAETTVRQTAEGISQIAQRQTEIDGEIEEQQTQLNQTSEKIDLQAIELTQHGEDIAEMSAQLTVQADAIKSKVSQTDIDKSIGDIKLDNRNGILNSDFSQDFDNWSGISSVFKVVKIGNKNYAQASRSGLTGDMVATITSNAIPVSVGQRVNIGVDVMVANTTFYDNRTMFILDMLDINDIRVDTVAFNSDVMGVVLQNAIPQRVNVTHKVEREDVAKVRLRLSLYRNGTISYTNILVQKGDIGVTEWTPNHDDTKAITAKLSTEITQTAEMISSKADKSVVDSLSGDFVELSSSINQTADSITSTVSSYTNKVDSFEQRIESTLYSWTMWADDDKGTNMSTVPEKRKWFGVAYNKGTLDPPPDVAYDVFTWTKVGIDATPIISLTNDLIVLPADENGVVTDYSYAKTEVNIHLEAIDVTSSWVITANATIGIDGVIAGNSYQITNMTAESGEVSFAATKNGVTLSRSVSVSIQKTGSSAKVHRIRKSHTIIIKDKSDILLPGVVTLTSESAVGNNGYTLNNVYYVIYERSNTAMTIDEYTHLYENGLILSDREYIISDTSKPYVERYRSVSPESIKEYVPTNPDIASIHVEIYQDKESLVPLDNETIMVASEGKDGEDSYRVEVLSTQGNTFKNGVIETWIYAVVYKGTTDITANIDANRFRWTRYSSDANADELWNQKYFGGAKEIKVTSQDIYQRATFMCDILSQ